MGRITYSDIVRHFRIDQDDAREWPAPGLTLRAGGVFVVNPDDVGKTYEGLTPEERAALTEHRKDAGFDEAALELPCTAEELADFLLWAGCEDLLPDDGGEFAALMQAALETVRAREAGQPGGSNAPAEPPATPLPRQRWQEEEVLRVIRELEYLPEAFPKNQPGKRGAKSEVRERLEWKGSIFNHAWDRLRKDKRIVDGRD
ncbi:hypothetical protein N234_15915 [Ralstonia pickettii DTP0602]|nr:hypothetical protein N234_15915 [Ralstonia pickettii DTP0602]